ncbi:MAG TPA: hypothetical protein VGC88_07845, partial [Terriglobales bacterium]
MLACSVAINAQTSSAPSTSGSSSNTQSNGSSTQSGTQQPSTDAQKPQVDVEGPQSTTAPVIVRKKTDADAPPKPEPKPEQPKKIEGLSEPTFSTTSALVNVDVSVIAKNGQFIPGLHKENFQVYEDGQPQKVLNFAVTEKPITAVLLVEFADINYNFLYDMLMGAYTFTDTLKKDDYVAVVEYD